MAAMALAASATDDSQKPQSQFGPSHAGWLLYSPPHIARATMECMSVMGLVAPTPVIKCCPGPIAPVRNRPRHFWAVGVMVS